MNGESPDGSEKSPINLFKQIIDKASRKIPLAFSAWVLGVSLVLVAVVWGIVRMNTGQEPVVVGGAAVEHPETAELPPYLDGGEASLIRRDAVYYTTIPERDSLSVIQYEVQFGDSVFAIAGRFEITPETLLWSNYNVLQDNPDVLAPGMVLSIPPVDGVYYQWEEGDTLESVAENFEIDVESILDWEGNGFDLVNLQVVPGMWVMLPGGEREFQQWVIPVIPRGSAGVSMVSFGPGACEGGYEGAYGTGSFAWPSPIHDIVGNDYWSGHLAIDIASGEGIPVLAADSGVVVFAGWANGGYGYMVMIDHGNGYATLYAHLSEVTVYCGNSVSKGQQIGYGGSTGNSTGPHLHFEVRYLEGFTNPHFVLPAP